MDKAHADRYLALAVEAASVAGRYLSQRTNDGIRVESQLGKDVKIVADRLAEKIILDILKGGSDLPILSEEKGLIAGSSRNDATWIVDPLDGSLNYLRSIPVSCVSVGLWQGNKPALGAIYDFNRGELFTGIVGEGAWLNKQPVRVSAVAASSGAVLFTGFPVKTDFSSRAVEDFVAQVREFKKVRLIGSAALSLAYVAAGRGDAYFERDIMSWDVAAGLAILMGAGGKYSIRDGAGSNVCDIYATNGLLPDILREVDRK